ncbi:MAG: Spy/CpxP family protein refolding chaperone [Candidatus Desulforudis sp.]|nr:Spy/CpxP family protein refolding chaperone [Desulforudis sp.]
MRRNLVSLTLALVLVFAITQVAAAGFGHGAGGRGIGADGWINMADELDLTAEQSAKIQEMHKQHFEKSNKLQDQLRATRQQLRIQSFNPKADQSKVQAQIKQTGEYRDQLLKEAADFRTELRGVLTDEQLAKWSEIRCGGPCRHPDGPLSNSPGGKGGAWR